MAGMSAALPAIGPALTVAGSLVSSNAYRQAGNAAQQSGQYQAAQLEQNAGQQTAAGQHARQDELYRSRLAQSAALARAASSGAGASDPTVVDIIGHIAQEGAYRGLIDVYQGEDKARMLKQQAAGARYSGDSTKAAYDTAASGSLFRGATSLFEKYASKWPPAGGGSAVSPGAFFDAGTPLNTSYG
jgi:hypothetical protein